MQIKQIHSRRRFEHEFYYDIVYEWEDVLSDVLGAPVIEEISPWVFYKAQQSKIARKLKLYPKKYALVFDMDPLLGNPRVNSPYIIPWIIDFYLGPSLLPKFNDCYRNHPFVLISCRDAYVYLLAHRDLCPDVRLKYLPLSLPDQYRIPEGCSYKKEVDVILFGNQDAKQKEFFDRYASSHHDLTYAYRVKENGHFAYYTNDSSFVGYADTRSEYMELMKKARISLYTTSMQYASHGEGHINFNHVTPRFFEMISCGCHVMMRYVENEDTRFFELNRFSPSLDEYDQFEKAMDDARKTDVDIDKYSNYLAKHYTSVRGRELQALLLRDE